jgi:hypothetical protein
MIYCGTAAKAGGNRENQPHPAVMGVPCLLTQIIASARRVLRIGLFLVRFGRDDGLANDIAELLGFIQ